MKRFVLLALLAALAVPAAQAQAVVKTKAKTDGQPTTKTPGPTAPAVPTRAPAPAPTSASTEARANALTTNMQQNLGLSPQQTEKVRAINQRGVAEVESARARYRTDPHKLQGIVENVGESRLAALKEVLTQAQFDKYQRKREEKMGVPSAPATQGNAAPGLGNE